MNHCDQVYPSKRSLPPEEEHHTESENEYIDSSEDEYDESEEKELSFIDGLRDPFLDLNLSQSQGTAILKYSQIHKCFTHVLPAYIRTLLNTRCSKIILRQVSPGEYIHLGIKTQIGTYIKANPGLTFLDHLELDISSDGANLDRQGTIDLRPISIRLAEVKNSTPIKAVKVYRGRKKPACPLDSFSDFVNEWKTLESEGGIVLTHKTITFSIRCVIADAPARAYFLYHLGHASPKSCSKCTLDGKSRTDADYTAQTDEHHHHRNSSLDELGDRPFVVPQKLLDKNFSVKIFPTKIFQ